MRLLLEDPRMSQINHLGEQLQVISAERLRLLPLVAVFVEPADRDIESSSVVVWFSQIVARIDPIRISCAGCCLTSPLFVSYSKKGLVATASSTPAKQDLRLR